MSKTVNNEGINARLTVGGLLDVNVQIGGGSTKANDQQNHAALRQVTQNLERNPNHARDPRPGRNQTQGQTGNAQHGNQVDGPPVNNNGNNNNQPTAKNAPAKGNPVENQNPPEAGAEETPADLNARTARGNGNGAANASEQGLANGRGHHKTGQQNQGQGQTQGQNQGQIPTQTQGQTQTQTETPVEAPNPTQAEEPAQIPKTGRREINQGQQKPIANQTPPRQDPPVNQFPKPTVNPPVMIETRLPHHDRFYRSQHHQNQNPPGHQNHFPPGHQKNHGNQHQHHTLRTLVEQVLRQNDLYLNRGAINQLVKELTNSPPAHGRQLNQHQHGNGHQSSPLQNLPREIVQLVRHIQSQTLGRFAETTHFPPGKIHQLARDLSIELGVQIETARKSILASTELGARHFKHLNIAERMQAAVDLLPRHAPPEFVDKLQNYGSNKVLDGLWLARGLVAGSEKTVDLKYLNTATANILPQNISLKSLGDIGRMVKILVSDAAAARSTVQLDLAVQKFVRFLIANNELGVLLATIDLAAQARDGKLLVNRSLALAQIYELITRLIVAGEKAMREAAGETAKSALLADDSLPLSARGTLAENDENINLSAKLQGAEGSLRQFLEFNPAMAFDSSASAFQSKVDAREAQQNFLSLYQNEIDSWLKSGNHRLVSEIELEKPVGVVFERDSDSVYTANRMRVVLVRDGSVQGWHFLKSFLVR